ncbi:MAG: Arc family DNA-binding protein [Devosia sp.]
MPQETPSRKLDQYIVRFPDGMRDRLKTAAASANRSLNAEIVDRLEQSFELSDGLESLGNISQNFSELLEISKGQWDRIEYLEAALKKSLENNERSIEMMKQVIDAANVKLPAKKP